MVARVSESEWPHQVDHLSQQGYSQECEENAEGDGAGKEQAKAGKS